MAQTDVANDQYEAARSRVLTLMPESAITASHGDYAEGYPLLSSNPSPQKGTAGKVY